MMMINNYYVQTALKCCYQCKCEELIKGIAEYMEEIKINCDYFVPHLIFDECNFGYGYDDIIIKIYHNKIKNRYFSDYIRLLQKNKLKHNIEYSRFINAMEKFNLLSYLEKSIIDNDFFPEQMFHNEYFNKNNNVK